MAAKKPTVDPLDALSQADPKRVIAMMLWQRRHQNPDMYVRIDERDIEGFDACMRYQKLQADVMIKRPAGIPGQEAIPATHRRRAVPAREATPPKPYVIVALVEKGTENAIRPIEDNQDDYDTAQRAAQIRAARDKAPALAALILRQAQSGESSLSDIRDAADALVLLASQ